MVGRGKDIDRTRYLVSLDEWTRESTTSEDRGTNYAIRRDIFVYNSQVGNGPNCGQSTAAESKKEGNSTKENARHSEQKKNRSRRRIEAEEELKAKKRRRELKGTIGWGGGSRSYSGLYMWSRSW